MSQLKEFFFLQNPNKLPKLLSKLVIKFSVKFNVEVAIIGDEEMVEDISENLKNFLLKILTFLTNLLMIFLMKN